MCPICEKKMEITQEYSNKVTDLIITLEPKHADCVLNALIVNYGLTATGYLNSLVADDLNADDLFEIKEGLFQQLDGIKDLINNQTIKLFKGINDKASKR